MYIRRQIRNITAPPLLLALMALGSLGFVIGILILRWGPGNARSQETLTIRNILAGKDIVFGSKPGLEELAELGCGMIVEPTFLRCVQPNRSIPIMVRFPTIRTVSFFGESLGSELESIEQLPELEHLLIRRCVLPDSLGFLGQLSNLRVLCIASSNLRDEDLRNVRLSMPLQKLDLSYNGGISEHGMTSFLNVGSLTSLNLTSTGVARLDFLDGMSELRELSLGQTEIDDEDMGLLDELVNLYRLELFGTRITDSAIDAIADIESLHHLDIRYTKVSRDAIQRLRPTVEVIYHDE